MNIKTLSVVLILLLTSTFSAWTADPPKPGADSHILKIYDFSSFFSSPEIHDINEDGHPLQMFPFNPREVLSSYWECGISPYMENYEELLSFVAERLPEFIDPEIFEYESAFIRTFGPSLFLRAPEKHHKKVQAFMDFIKHRWDQSITIDLQVCYLADPSPLESLDTQTIQHAINKGILKSIFNRTVKINKGGLFDIHDGIETMVAWSAYTEIAEKSVLSVPQLEKLFVGLDLALRPVLVNNGTKVAINLYGMASRFIEPLSFKELNINGRIALEQAAHEVNLINKIDNPKIEFASVAAHLAAAPGETTGVQVVFPHHKGVGSLVILAKPHFTPPLTNMVDLGENKVLSAIDFSFLQIQDILRLHYSGVESRMRSLPNR